MVIISQGPLFDPERMDEAWPAPVIHSTWKGERKVKCGVYSDLPPVAGHTNVCFQQKSTLEGLKEAKRQGFTTAFKIRSDLFPTDGEKLIELQKPGVNFLFWHDWEGGYYVDYLMSGSIDDLIAMWSFTESHLFPERLLTNQVKACNLGPINYFGDKLTKENNLFWAKRGLSLTDYQSDPRFQLKYD